ncbi:NACHT, LRR and PYD domains-containing protein 6-like [Acipenser oxyrinchus oxyrinchus]|uniref:NACHT, LRR and PYD domains-containing protein 6-like n=1 Tax=Acipenser oxyrinchus oxyrinchus TaxID=40147 RepID=A0AAD8CJ58_ACIOX|nr:NACHT, LRR and PYD domains-containing protein 6-like [Acipenser oxyrinchus oxyrinchus]
MARYCGDILIKHLDGLRNTEFKRFRSKLKSYEQGKLQIPRGRLERAGVDETVELLIQCFVNQAVPVAVEVLKRCNVNNVAQELHSEWEKERKKRKSELLKFEEDEVKSIKSEPHLYARPTNPAPRVSSETSPSEACAQDSPIPEDSEQDETALFMMSLQARLKRLSPVKRSIAMIDIQTILHQHEFNSS